MVLRLGATLDAPLRDENALLAAAGFNPQFEEPSLEHGLPPSMESALERSRRTRCRRLDAGGDPCLVSLDLEEAGGVTTLVRTMKFASKEARDGASPPA